MSITDDLAAISAEFTGWHIWRGRSLAGSPTDWHATGKRPRRGKLAAPDADGLRHLLAQHEALSGEARGTAAA